MIDNNLKELSPLQYRTFDVADEYALECLHGSLKELNNTLALNDFQSNFNNTISLSLEFYKEDCISLEGFVDTIKTYWKKFIQWLKDVWAKLIKFFSDHFTIIGRRKKAIKTLLVRVKRFELSKATRSLKQEVFIDLTDDNLVALTIGNQLITNTDKLKDAINETRKAYSFIQNQYSSNILDRANLIKDTINKATVENSKDLLDALVSDLNKNNPNPVKFEVLGNTLISYERPKDDLDTVSQLKQNKVIIERKKNAKADGESKFKAVHYRELIPLLEAMVEIMDDFEKFRNQGYQKIIDYQKNLISITDKYINKLGSYLSSHKDAATGSQELYRSIMNLNSVYLDWIKAPVVDSLRIMVSSFYQITLIMKKIIDEYTIKRPSIYITDFLADSTVNYNLINGNTISKANGKIGSLVTSDPSIAAAGGACTFVLNPDMKRACKRRLDAFRNAEDKEALSNNPDLLKELEFISNLEENSSVILFSKFLKERLTSAEYQALYDHEVGHIVNKDTDVDSDKINKTRTTIESSDIEIAADKYSYSRNDPRDLKKALEKAISFCGEGHTATTNDLTKINSKSAAAKFFNMMVDSTYNFKVKSISESTKRLHARRLKALDRVIEHIEQEEKK